MQHHLATGRTITTGLAPNTNLGGCQPSPVKVCWATPCHPLEHGLHPGVCFLSLILVPPIHLLNLILNPAPRYKSDVIGRARAGQRRPQPRKPSWLSAAPVVRHGEADHNGLWAWCFAGGVCVCVCVCRSAAQRVAAAGQEGPPPPPNGTARVTVR